MSIIATALPHLKARLCVSSCTNQHLFVSRCGSIAPPYLRSAALRSIVTHISSTTSLLRSNTTDNEVYLIGTAHVSDASTKEVVDLIDLVQPHVVFVELDSARAAQLRNGGTASNYAESVHFDLSKITSNPLFGAFGKAGLPKQILDAVPALLKRIGWLPPQGGEMKAALEEADRIGARCVYGDVEFSQTMREVKSAMMGMMNPAMLSSIPPPPAELSSIFGGLLSGQNDPNEIVEMIKTRDHAKKMTTYLSRSFPPVYDAMITKRDIHMAKMLRQHCSNGKVVAVVGIAHVEGIEREWEKLDTKQLSLKE